MPESNSIHVHKLDGCRPTPLAHYLKALGILRLVAEQKDPAVRGWWRDDVFHLATRLDRDELQRFFLEDYQPTPILSPWLKGSGFYQANDPGLTPIEDSQAPRFGQLRDGIAKCRKLLEAIVIADSIIRAIKARTKTNRTFQTQEQRALLANSNTLQSYRKSLIEECVNLKQIMDTDADNEGDSRGEELVEMKKKLEKEGITAEDQSKKVQSELETIDGLVSEPRKDPKTGQVIRPSKQQAEKLKKSEGYKRALRLAEAIFSALKSNLITECKRTWRGPLSKWFAAAVVIGDDDTADWPALLGTGGNDGNLDFTNNFMQQIGNIFDLESAIGSCRSGSAELLRLGLYSESHPGLDSGKIGQFFPGTAGGPNSSSGFHGNAAVNPWDYVLLLEGAFLFRAGLTRWCRSKRLPQAAAPFAVWPTAAAYGSSESVDNVGRGEQWMPLWKQPSTVSEVQSVFREGRCQIDGKSPERGSDMARAVARMGVVRGIQQFERVGYLRRNGDNHYAIPLGRFDVTPRPNQDLLDEVVPWIDRLRRIASDKNAPTSFDRAHRACEEAVFSCTRDSRGHRFLPLLVALGRAEDQFLQSPKFAADKYARPIPRLSERWLHVLCEEEDSPELRLAIALASQHGKLKSSERSQSVRIHWLPLDGSYFAKGESGLSVGPEQSSFGQDLQRALMSLMHRRLIAYEREAGGDFIPLHIPRWDVGAEAKDIQAFIEHRVDDATILAMARGLMAITFRSRQSLPITAKAREPLGGLALYGLLRLALPVAPIWLPEQSDKKVHCNPSVFHRLKNGSLDGAIEIATRQLAAAGLRPRLRIGIGSPQLARRLAVSMAFGISSETMTCLALGLTQPELGRDERRECEAASEP